jgi:hypothetical protein
LFTVGITYLLSLDYNLFVTILSQLCFPFFTKTNLVKFCLFFFGEKTNKLCRNLWNAILSNVNINKVTKQQIIVVSNYGNKIIAFWTRNYETTLSWHTKTQGIQSCVMCFGSRKISIRLKYTAKNMHHIYLPNKSRVTTRSLQ